MSTVGWLALAGLGAFHGANPAMGWLFAVALGLHRRSRAIVLASLLPIALGHAAAVAVIALALVALGMAIDAQVVRVGAGIVLVAWAVYHHLYGARHHLRIGMRTGMVGLAVWSFAMASAHGAGLMLVPVLLPLGEMATQHAHAGPSLAITLAAVAVHTLAMLAVTGVIAVAVYEWVGVAFLRRGWINLDRLWAWSLAATGVILIVLVPPTH
ncbi:MAG TPA: hypothetical protein VIE36_16835 [Methylomirabilota bacterium]